MKKINRKEVYLDDSIVKAIEVKAKKAGSSVKSYLENVIIEDVKGRKNYFVAILRRYKNEKTIEYLPDAYYREDAIVIGKQIASKLSATELLKPRSEKDKCKLLEFLVYIDYPGDVNLQEAETFYSAGDRGGLHPFDTAVAHY